MKAVRYSIPCFLIVLLALSVAVSAEDMLISPISADTDIDSVILATNSNYPDTIVASVVAEKIGAPLLLTDPGALSPETKAEIEALGVSTIYVIGGPAVIAEDVQEQLGESYSVVRIWGMTRYGTAVKVAEYFWEESEHAVLVWDSLARPESGNSEMVSQAKEIASELGVPLLLINKNFIPDQVLGALQNLSVQSVTVIGNVGPDVTSSLDDLGIAIDEQIKGATPEQTREMLKERLRERIRTMVRNHGKRPLVVIAVGNWSDTIMAPCMPNGTSRHISSEEQIDDLIAEISELNYSRIYVVGKPELARIVYDGLTAAGISVTHVSGRVAEVAKQMVQNEKETIRRIAQAAKTALRRTFSLKVNATDVGEKSQQVIDRIDASLSKVGGINKTMIMNQLNGIRDEMLEDLENGDHEGAWLMYQRLVSEESQIILRYQNWLLSRYQSLRDAETKYRTLADTVKSARTGALAADAGG
ncbi:MAG: cell wall-binding repeat-containing protein [Candidatus Aenigmarchaeota archaeon]|nr:cell wall-binding repeat-containing protein [Candidatus Aenigmarchaeota archaeon]